MYKRHRKQTTGNVLIKYDPSLNFIDYSQNYIYFSGGTDDVQGRTAVAGRQQEENAPGGNVTEYEEIYDEIAEDDGYQKPMKSVESGKDSDGYLQLFKSVASADAIASKQQATNSVKGDRESDGYLHPVNLVSRGKE